jgi:catechol 2,3-dioxygenase-like lactoylglutathione lyase family enzyme
MRDSGQMEASGHATAEHREGQVVMCRRVLTAMLLLSLFAAPAWSQLSAPNAMGVAMGHIHYVVRDVEANQKFWIALGGRPLKVGGVDALAFPDTFVFLSRGESSGGSNGSVVNHVAFTVRSLTLLEASGMKVTYARQYPGVASVVSPEGEHIELFDETSENLAFALDPGVTDAAAERHHRKMTVPIVAHHIHLYVPAGAEVQAKEWYARRFGGANGKRWHYDATDLPGINLNFSSTDRPAAPTKGRMLDHIGFEVANLKAFCRQLEADGIKLETPYTAHADGIASAWLTDPWGTSIELTEGLKRLSR